MNPLLAALVAAGLVTQDEAERIDRMMDTTAARAYAERVLGEAIQRGFLSQQTRYLDLVERGNGQVSLRQLDAFWMAEDGALWETVRPTLLDLVSERSVGVAVALGNVDGWGRVNEAVIDWAQTWYANADAAAFGSIPNLNLTSRTQVLQAFTDWQRGELQTAGAADGLPQLARALEPVFGAERAERIAVTETTRIFSEATRAAAEADPSVTALRLLTAADELVCPICGPLQGLLTPKGSNGFVHPSMGMVGFPPFHVRCRCGVTEETAQTEATANQRSDRFVYTGA